MAGQNKLTFAYEIKVQNTYPKPISILVEDQLPISKEKDILINALEISGAQLQEDIGLLSWYFDLQPGETKTVILSFSIRYPRTMALQVMRKRVLGCPTF